MKNRRQIVLIIKIPKPNNLQELLERAKSDADKHDLSYEGDITKGHASGKGFEGSYTIDANFITIRVNKKPVLVSKAKIETEIKKYLAAQ
jgi:hypothetical protein